MASKSVLELAVGTGQWDSGLKKAKQALDNFTQANGGLQSALNKDSQSMQQFVKMMGQMDSTAKTAKGQMNDYKGTIEQLTMQYNRLTDAQKKTIGQDYLRSIDQMKQKYQGVAEEVQKINQSLKTIPEPAAMSGGGLFGGGKMSGMLQVFGGNVMTKLAGAGMGFVTEMGDMVKQGIELARAGEGIRIAFERLGRGDILDGLRKATHGTVTDLELMKAAVKFNDFKLPLDELGTMLAFAQQKAKDTGQSVDYMVDSIVTGLGRKSLMILDNLGLSATEIRERMKETGDMTKAVGAIIRDEMAKAGDYVETAADRAAQANVSLQNKMEELGRKFGPLEQASSNLWTSIKIGIMDIVGGPLTEFINKLTEAGRLAQQYGVLGGSGKVGRMINNLSGTREGNRQSVYQQQQEQFWRYINPREQQIRDIRAWQRGERGEALQKRVSAITDKYGSLDATKIQAEVDAAKKMLNEYIQAAKTVLNGGNSKNTPTTSTNTITPTGTTTTTTPKVKADTDDFKEMEEVVGLLNLQKKKLDDLQAMKPFAETEDEIARLNREIETANKEYERLLNLGKEIKSTDLLGKAQNKLAEAKQTGNLKDIYTAQSEVQRLTQKVDVVPGTVTMPDVPSSVEVPINYTESNLGAFVSHLKEQLSQAELGSELYNNLTAQLADTNTLGNLMETAIKNGIDTAQFNPQALWRKIFGDTPDDYISNEEWKSHVSTLNQQIRDNENKDGQNKNRTRFKFDRNTGEIKKEDNKETQIDILKGVETMTGSLQGIFDGINKLGIELPQELTNIFGVVQTIASIVSAIQTMETVGKFLGIIPGFAHGGVVHAANGYVDGNTYSGDQIPAMLNAGEVVLNRSQAGVLAASLQAIGQDGNGGGGKPYVSGEMIWLGLTNYLNRSGRGEIMTSKRR